jgi:hypothetical protein
MTQAQAGMQECLVVFARSLKVLHEPPKARAIEIHECSLNVIPGWRGVLATDHGHQSFKDSFLCAPLGMLRIPDLRIGNRLIRSMMPNQCTRSAPP